MRSRPQQPLLKVLPKPVVDGESDDQRCDPGGNSCDRNASNDADKSLPPFGAQVSGRDEEFEAHEETISRQQSAKPDYNGIG
jgi:hypothetical protein